MTVKYSARKVRAMLKKADAKPLMASITSESSAGNSGACVATRHHPGTIDVCREMSKEACDIVDKELGNDGFTKFYGPGSHCPS